MNSCPRCRGNLIQDWDGIQCLQCGYTAPPQRQPLPHVTDNAWNRKVESEKIKGRPAGHRYVRKTPFRKEQNESLAGLLRGGVIDITPEMK